MTIGVSVTRRDDRGFSSPVLVAVLAALVLGLGGVSADLWRVIAAHRELVGHVDAAAAAGATAIDEARLYVDPLADRLEPGEATARACARLRATDEFNAAPCPGPRIDVTVTDTRISVVAERAVPLTLLGVLTPGGPDDVVVGATSVVEVVRGSP
jgi:hypothetical protein